MPADRSATEDQPFVQRKSSTKGGVRHLRFECPNCTTVRTKREDSFLIGAHILICNECGYSTDKVQQNGRVRKKTASDHRSPDDAKR